MGSPRDTVYFLSDYGLADEFVGVVKAVILRAAPRVQVVDLTHEVPRHDVRSGALALWRAAPYILPGVVLAVVDPGVGTQRRGIAVRSADGSFFIGPDNGLVGSAASWGGGAVEAVCLDLAPLGPDPHPQAARKGAGKAAGKAAGQVGPTFAGRDVFAPAVGRLCTGAELSSLGPSIEVSGIGELELFEWSAEGEALRAEVTWVDRFGNAQLSVRPENVAHLGDRMEVRSGGTTVEARRAGTFAEIGPGELGVITDSTGQLALAMYLTSASGRLGLAPGDEVMLTPAQE